MNIDMITMPDCGRSKRTKMKMTAWFLQVEMLLGFKMDASLALEAHQKYNEGWTANEFATEIDERRY